MRANWGSSVSTRCVSIGAAACPPPHPPARSAPQQRTSVPRDHCHCRCCARPEPARPPARSARARTAKPRSSAPDDACPASLRASARHRPDPARP
ncbi:hypothetical protein [Lysobacter gummosus]|uniref:hypothetical protein n=1 Tax=Lysobacter gummosus TaxID=262324 RepID=UPI003636D003